MYRRAKIVATLGPASSNESAIRELIQAGMNVARINFSHGAQAEHAVVIATIRRIAREMGQPVTILQDLQGPKIRTGEIEDGSINLQKGQKLTLTIEPILGTSDQVSVDYDKLPESASMGERILLDDGNLELEVVSITPTGVETRVTLGGVLKPHKGVNLPGASLNIQSFTEKDRQDLIFGLSQNVDAIALSFVRSAQDIINLRDEIQRIDSSKTEIPIIAKLERPEALDNLHEILHVVDGVMVARGDLGVELPPQRVPIEQKRIIHLANRHLKVVITATQMLESMMNNPRPTRAEASDVANAIFDGSDLVMLSGETAVGQYPVKAVETMADIIHEAEEHMAEWGHFDTVLSEDISHEDALYITRAARELAFNRQVAAIAVFTISGRTARMMSKARPGVPILAFTTQPTTLRKMSMYWGVRPFIVPHVDTVEDMLEQVRRTITESTELQPGQEVVLVAGFPIGAMRSANFLLLHEV
ncbi:MAG TPA: pyruvate kinase [Chloroflexi bacterium]|nr:pyruvate kinase [Chloroflexota bacterium]